MLTLVQLRHDLFIFHAASRAFSFLTSRVHFTHQRQRLGAINECENTHLFHFRCISMLYDLVELPYSVQCNWLHDHIRDCREFLWRALIHYESCLHSELTSVFSPTFRFIVIHPNERWNVTRSTQSACTHFIHTSYWSSSECSSLAQPCGMQSAPHDYKLWLWSGYVKCSERRCYRFLSTSSACNASGGGKKINK